MRRERRESEKRRGRGKYIINNHNRQTSDSERRPMEGAKLRHQQ